MSRRADLFAEAIAAADSLLESLGPDTKEDALLWSQRLKEEIEEYERHHHNQRWAEIRAISEYNRQRRGSK